MVLLALDLISRLSGMCSAESFSFWKSLRHEKQTSSEVVIVSGFHRQIENDLWPVTQRFPSHWRIQQFQAPQLCRFGAKSVASECRSHRSRAALRFGDFVAESLVTLAPDARMLSHGRIGIYSYGYNFTYFPQEPSNRQAENGLARSAPLRGFGLHLGNRPQQKWRKISSKYQFLLTKGGMG